MVSSPVCDLDGYGAVVPLARGQLICMSRVSLIHLQAFVLQSRESRAQKRQEATEHERPFLLSDLLGRLKEPGARSQEP